MKLFVGIAAIFWLLCGLIGAWMLDELDTRHWKTVALGPISLIEAFNEAGPVRLATAGQGFSTLPFLVIPDLIRDPPRS